MLPLRAEGDPNFLVPLAGYIAAADVAAAVHPDRIAVWNTC